MGVPQLTGCCFCCTTETGSKVIGWFHTVASIIATVFAILGIIALSIAVNNKDEHAGDYTALLGLSIVLFIIYLFSSILGICLLVGIYKRKLGLIRLYVTVSTVLLCINVVLLIIYCVTLVSGIGHPAELIKMVISLIVSSYFLLVVYSYYRELKFGTNAV